MAYQPTGGASASETPTLLWENPSPNQAFSTQTTISASNYPFIIVEYKSTYTSGGLKMTTCIDRLNCESDICLASPNFGRRVILGTENITIASSATQIGGTTSNGGYTIPLRVYGCKKIPYEI